MVSHLRNIARLLLYLFAVLNFVAAWFFALAGAPFADLWPAVVVAIGCFMFANWLARP